MAAEVDQRSDQRRLDPTRADAPARPAGAPAASRAPEAKGAARRSQATGASDRHSEGLQYKPPRPLAPTPAEANNLPNQATPFSHRITMVHRILLPVCALLALLSVGCGAQEAMGCEGKTVVTDFNADMYMGKWYEYAKMGSIPYEEGGICVTANYTLTSGNITVVNAMKDNATMAPNSTTGWAEFAGSQQEAKLKLHFPNSPAVGNYWVLSTDYYNYSIVWSCSQRPESAETTEISWILLRSMDNSNMTLDKVEEELKTLKLDELSKYTKTEQSAKLCSGAEHVVGALLSVVMASLLALLH